MGCKSLVQLKQIDITHGPTRTLECFTGRRHWAHAHRGRIQTAGGIGLDGGQGLQAQRSSLAGFHNHHRSRAVVETRRITSCHGACFVKGRAQSGQRFQIGLAIDVLIAIKYHRIALTLRDDHRHDFILELASILRGSRFSLAGDGQLILLRAGDLVFLSDILSRDTHVVLVVDIPQSVHDHGVLHFPVAHALPIARALQYVGGQAHAFLTAGYHDLAVTRCHGLSSQHHGLQPRATDSIDGQCPTPAVNTCPIITSPT